MSNNENNKNNEKYEKVLESIKDPEIKALYKEITNENLHHWNMHLCELTELFMNDSYEKILSDSYLNSMLLSTPENWVFFLKDEDFLRFIQTDWKDVKKTVFDFDVKQLYKNKNNSEEVEYQIKNINKVKKIIEILNKMYPDRFEL